MKIAVELVKYDMDKTKKRKRANFSVDAQTEEAVIAKLEKIHKGEKVQAIHELVWGEEQAEKQSHMKKITGKVKYYDDVKGFGFIEPDEDMDDLFFHATSLGGGTVHDHDTVQFEVSEGPKGHVAVNVKRVD